MWGYLDGTNQRPIPKKPGAPTDDEAEALEKWDSEDCTAQYLLSNCVPDRTAITLSKHSTAKAQWEKLTTDYTAKNMRVRIALERAFFEIHRRRGQDVRAFLADLRQKYDELVVAGADIAERDYWRIVRRGLPDELATFAARNLAIPQEVDNMTIIDTYVLIGAICKEDDQLEERRALRQRDRRRRRKGRC
jgi:hypothetical protein